MNRYVSFTVFYNWISMFVVFRKKHLLYLLLLYKNLMFWSRLDQVLYSISNPASNIDFYSKMLLNSLKPSYSIYLSFFTLIHFLSCLFIFYFLVYLINITAYVPELGYFSSIASGQNVTKRKVRSCKITKWVKLYYEREKDSKCTRAKLQ